MSQDSADGGLTEEELRATAAAAAGIISSTFPGLTLFNVSLRMRGRRSTLRVSYAFTAGVTELFSEDLGIDADQRTLLSAFVRLEARVKSTALQ